MALGSRALRELEEWILVGERRVEYRLELFGVSKVDREIIAIEIEEMKLKTRDKAKESKLMLI